MRSYLKENDIRIKNGVDVNAVMRDIPSYFHDIQISALKCAARRLHRIMPVPPHSPAPHFYHINNSCPASFQIASIK